MKKHISLLFVLIFSICAIQTIFSQKKTVKPQKEITEEQICNDCDPPDDPPCNSNPIDDATFFVQQQYRDFLYRNPTGAELANDVAPLNSCLLAANFACYNTERVKMSRRMWDKTEFRQQSRTFGLPLTSGNEFYNNEDFVELEYLIYLQRSSSAPPDDYRRLGYYFWLGGLDSCTNATGKTSDEYSQCYNDSINAFLQSTEYRERFDCD